MELNKIVSSGNLQDFEEPKIFVVTSEDDQLQSFPSTRIVIGSNESGLHQRKHRRGSLEHASAVSASETRSHETVSTGEVSESNHCHVESSSKEAKSKMTKKSMSTILSITYAIFIVTFGSIIYVGDAFVTLYPWPEAFSIAIIAISFGYFIFLMIDIRIHLYKTQKVVNERKRINQLVKDNTNTMDLSREQQVNQEILVVNKSLILLQHKYCFATGRHGEFLYLKLGATWFCFGLLIHSALQITYQVTFLTSTDPIFSSCASVPSLALEVLFPVYSIFILFFIFKYINVVVNVCREMARLFLMHAIGTSGALWIRAIVHETVDAINLGKLQYETDSEEKEYLEQLHSFSDDPHKLFVECPGPRSLNTIYKNFSPYFYPFIIEFCILIVGIWYMMWSNISQCCVKRSIKQVACCIKDDTLETSRDSSNVQDLDCVLQHEINMKGRHVIVADCHASHRGLFCGFFLLVLTIVDIILFFVAVNEAEYFEIGQILNRAFELCVLVAMLICTLLAYFQTSTLDINTHPMSKLDDVLLFIAIPAFFLETTFSMVPAVLNESSLNISVIVLQLVQILVQTPWIIDALRRCANSQTLQEKKPGRELVIFMAIANVSLWVYYTFSVKTGYNGDERYAFYGATLWKILNHISLPLIMFYRFHSSVCLVDIWRHSYEPEGH